MTVTMLDLLGHLPHGLWLLFGRVNWLGIVHMSFLCARLWRLNIAFLLNLEGLLLLRLSH